MVNIIDKRSPAVQKVNKLLQIVFGKRFAGNFNFAGKKVSKLDRIVNRRYLGFYKIIGQFPKGGDGSEIKILPNYESQAIKYAKLYEKELNKKVQITLDPEAYAGPPSF